MQVLDVMRSAMDQKVVAVVEQKEQQQQEEEEEQQKQQEQQEQQEQEQQQQQEEEEEEDEAPVWRRRTEAGEGLDSSDSYSYTLKPSHEIDPSLNPPYSYFSYGGVAERPPRLDPSYNGGEPHQ